MQALILGDDYSSQARLAAALMATGFQVICVESVGAAASYVRTQMIDVLIVTETRSVRVGQSCACIAHSQNRQVSVLVVTDRTGPATEELFEEVPQLYGVIGFDLPPAMIAGLAQASILPREPAGAGMPDWEAMASAPLAAGARNPSARNAEFPAPASVPVAPLMGSSPVARAAPAAGLPQAGGPDPATRRPVAEFGVMSPGLPPGHHPVRPDTFAAAGDRRLIQPVTRAVGTGATAGLAHTTKSSATATVAVQDRQTSGHCGPAATVGQPAAMPDPSVPGPMLLLTADVIAGQSAGPADGRAMAPVAWSAPGDLADRVHHLAPTVADGLLHRRLPVTGAAAAAGLAAVTRPAPVATQHLPVLPDFGPDLAALEHELDLVNRDRPSVLPSVLAASIADVLPKWSQHAPRLALLTDGEPAAGAARPIRRPDPGAATLQ